MEQQIITHLRNLPIGTKGYIVGFDQVFGGYQGKLVAMGLTPGTQFIVIRQASNNSPIILEVKKTLLTLTKPESDALCIEATD